MTDKAAYAGWETSAREVERIRHRPQPAAVGEGTPGRGRLYHGSLGGPALKAPTHGLPVHRRGQRHSAEIHAGDLRGQPARK